MPLIPDKSAGQTGVKRSREESDNDTIVVDLAAESCVAAQPAAEQASEDEYDEPDEDSQSTQEFESAYEPTAAPVTNTREIMRRLSSSLTPSQVPSEMTRSQVFTPEPSLAESSGMESAGHGRSLSLSSASYEDSQLPSQSARP